MPLPFPIQPSASLNAVQVLVDAMADHASATPAALFEHLVQQGLADLPLPGGGQTLERWQMLSAVARHNLSLAKFYEGHTDALAILAELGSPTATTGHSWAMWAAEAPDHRVVVTPQGASGLATLSGSKAWCSGSHAVTHALLTAWLDGEPQPQLVEVAMSHPSIRSTARDWHAVGMADTLSAQVTFQETPATLIGRPGDYLKRPGFWHGGAGIAACWYGGALAVADALRVQMQNASPKHPGYPFRAASFGKVDCTLAAVAAVLRESAAHIDADPRADAIALALRVRQAAHAAATLVLAETGRALGAAPFCRDAAFAQAAADLPVFLRQSHGDRDDAALASAVMAQDTSHLWSL